VGTHGKAHNRRYARLSCQISEHNVWTIGSFVWKHFMRLRRYWCVEFVWWLGSGVISFSLQQDNILMKSLAQTSLMSPIAALQLCSRLQSQSERMSCNNSSQEQDLRLDRPERSLTCRKTWPPRAEDVGLDTEKDMQPSIGHKLESSPYN